MAQSGRADLSLQSNSLDWRQKNFTLLRADKNLCQTLAGVSAGLDELGQGSFFYIQTCKSTASFPTPYTVPRNSAFVSRPPRLAEVSMCLLAVPRAEFLN